MIAQTLPDLAASLRLQEQASLLRAQLEAAGQEMVTGLVADVRSHTGGDLAPVFGLDARLADLEVREQGLALAAARADATQVSLLTLEDAVSGIALDLSSAVSSGDQLAVGILQQKASGNLITAMDALNVSFGGKTLFSGAAENGPALASADTLLTAISAIVAVAPDAATAEAQIDAYFDTAGGSFETDIYLGSTTDAAGAPVDEDRRLGYLTRADAPEIRENLKGLAMIAVADDAAFAGDPVEWDAFLGSASSKLLAANESLTGLRATVGVGQADIELARDAGEAEASAIIQTRNELIGADQFEAAAEFADLEASLQALFTVTARVSTLRLTNFLP
ncbi:MAG: hypothetical protein AAFV62_05815 [Pseudomonadota bacterium]